ncbi:hypothetical protein TWF694_007652 [Orbilia ellipsospora]|uniref:Uncharacterized protein n=1 Tax=Orbilia ellipsospora TaxID=2528407 RepID=A0AAV9XKY5_9PEZI
MAFLDSPAVDSLTSTDEIPWEQYQPGVKCTKIHPTSSGFVNKIFLRNSPNQANPPRATAFYDAGLAPIDPSHDPCAEGILSFMIRWYPYPNSLQTHITTDGSMSHFSEITLDDPAWSSIKDLADGDIAILDFWGGWKIFKNDVRLSFPDYLVPGTPEPDDNEVDDEVFLRAAESVTTMDEEDPDALAATAEQEAEELIFDTGLFNQEGNPFKEMFNFEAKFPEMYQEILNHFIRIRQDALSKGIYIPIPPGLILRYSDDELEDMGLPQDIYKEAEAWYAITEKRRTTPGFDSSTPFLFRLFEGREPGIFDKLLLKVFNRVSNTFGMTRADFRGSEPQAQTPNLQDLAQTILSMPQPRSRPRPQSKSETQFVGAAPSYLDDSEGESLDAESPMRDIMGQSVSPPEGLNGGSPYSIPQDQWSTTNQNIPGDHGLSAYSPATFSINVEQEDEECRIHDECLTEIEEEYYNEDDAN